MYWNKILLITIVIIENINISVQVKCYKCNKCPIIGSVANQSYCIGRSCVQVYLLSYRGNKSEKSYAVSNENTLRGCSTETSYLLNIAYRYRGCGSDKLDEVSGVSEFFGAKACDEELCNHDDFKHIRCTGSEIRLPYYLYLLFNVIVVKK